MLSQKRHDIAQNIGKIVAYDLFVSMLNPKYRGKNFNWDLFIDMVKRRAALQVSLTGDFGKDNKLMERIAENVAQSTAEHCIKASGIKHASNNSTCKCGKMKID